MHWLLMRPAVGWGAFLLIHAVGIPLVYMMGKACAIRKAQGPQSFEETPAVENTH
jgi:hypothetical protein